jgi:hypothetical protein
MGGAGAWHLGLHYPDRWCSVSPGAGFSTTHGYVKNLPAKLPPHQEACLRIYDAVNYAENAFNVPIVAYGGENDPQLQAAKNIEEKLKPLGIPLTLIVGPDTEHRYHPESLKTILKLQAEHAAKGTPEYPAKIRFVTYTPHYGKCFWVSVLAQERQYERSFVEVERLKDGFRVQATNVRLLELSLPPDSKEGERVAIEINGIRFETRSYFSSGSERFGHYWTPSVVLECRGGKWSAPPPEKVLTDASRRLQKDNWLSGPIDIAFKQPFLCVRGSGKPWHTATQKYAEMNLKRFQDEWSKYFRGDLPVIEDVQVSSADMREKHLILFGDPASNSLIGHALDRLPLHWDENTIAFGGNTYPAATHVPVMIFPSPFSTSNSIVLNSGHTFHAADFEGTNALLYPRLGDYAILKLTPTEKDPLAMEVVNAGLFDEKWQVPK